MTTTTQPAPTPVTVPGRGYAIASLILGLFPVIPIGGSILAIVFGHMSRSDSRRAGQKGSAMALWGIVLGWLSIVLSIVLIIVFVVAASKTSSNLSNLPSTYPTS